MGPPEVGVVVLHTQPVEVTTELPGRINPYAVAQVRPQINGIIKARLFREGSDVKAGAVLYQIDPAVYRAAFDQAQAQLANARANLTTAQLKAERYAALDKQNAISKQDYDDAEAAYLQAKATVEQDAAALESARINLDYTRITAPIGGRVGISAYTQGALVTANQTDALTSVQTLDPIYVDITQSSAELLALRRGLSAGGPQASANVTLILEDGSRYARSGKLQFTDITVDQTTGAVTLRALFPNPDGVLLPGMFVRAIVTEERVAAILAPQQGITRDPSGRATALVVDRDGIARLRNVETERAIGDRWLVTGGLEAGDRLIVEGLQRVQPGQPVRAVAAGSPARPPH
jgi:membrane fusion protein (multidrug efflux system)